MPYISVKTSAAVTAAQEKELKEKLGKAIELIPGKNESWLMVSIEPGVSMYFRGDNSSPCAMVEIKIFGSASSSAYDRLTAKVCEIMNSVAGIDSGRVYVKYEESSLWGWNGSNF